MEHFRKLEKVYKAGAINRPLKQKIEVQQDRCIISHEVDPAYFHAGDALHGAMYFKLLDDSSYFACASREKEFFIVTINYKVELLRPVTQEKLRAEGTCTGEEQGKYFGKSVLYNEAGKVVARGSGEFVRSAKKLSDLELIQ